MSLLSSLITGIFGGNSQKKAEKQAQAAYTEYANKALDLQKSQYDQTRADYAPWREAGANALGNLTQFVTPGADISALIQSDPGYQFRLNQGTDNITSNRAARGALDSGGTLKALTQYGQDYASNETNNIFNRYASVAGLGQAATGATASAGSNYANNSSNINTGLGNALASSYRNVGSINASMWGGIGGSINNAENALAQILGGMKF